MTWAWKQKIRTLITSAAKLASFLFLLVHSIYLRSQNYQPDELDGGQDRDRSKPDSSSIC